MKRWTLALLAPLLCGAGPQPLLVGVVHDQYGQAVAGARVQVGSRQADTDAAGTFALADDGPSGWVEITCSYCRPLRTAYQAGEPVLAIVQRYDALTQSGPTRRDIAALPYASAASTVALTPYAVLNDSASPIPGARVSMFGASPFWGGLTIDDGIPSYDVAASASTFPFFPASFVQQVNVQGPAAAFRYGDNAGSGTFFMDTRPENGTWAGGSAGSAHLLRIAGNDGAFASSAGLSGSAVNSVDRIDASWSVPAGDDTFSGSAILAGSHDAATPGTTLDAAFNAVRFAYRRVRANTLQANVIFDNGGYNGQLYEGAGVSGAWSDFEADAGVQTSGALHGFADISLRDSTGSYADPTLASGVAGSIAQNHLDAGAQYNGYNYTATAGVGAFGIGFHGGSGGVSQPLNASAVLPSVSFSWAFAPRWNASISSSQWFRLPSLSEAYGSLPLPTDLSIPKNSSTIEQLDYGDLRRVRVELVGVQGTANAAGGTFAWEIAPNLSIRAWSLHFDNAAESAAQTVNSAWATYENPAGWRIDAMERRDELDDAPDQHFDWSVSAPLAAHVRWFAVSQRRRLERTYETGLQLAP